MAWIVIVGNEDRPASTYLVAVDDAEEAERLVADLVWHEHTVASRRLAEAAAKVLAPREIKQWVGDGRPPSWDGTG